MRHLPKVAGFGLHMLHDVFGKDGESHDLDLVYTNSEDMCADIHTKSFVSYETWTHAIKLVNVVAESEIFD